MNTADMAKRLAERNVLCSGVNPQLMRFVTHRDVTRHDCECALEAVDAVCGKTVAVNN
jgi:threonine aldolase